MSRARIRAGVAASALAAVLSITLSSPPPAHAKDELPKEAPKALRPTLLRLRSTDPNERHAGRGQLRALGPDAVAAIPSLLEFVAREMDAPQKDRIVRPIPAVGAVAADSLDDMGPRAHAALIAGLKARDLRDRRAAAYVLRYRPPLAAAAPLAKALDERDSPIRAYALEALGKLRAPGAVPGATKCLRDPLMDVRKQAVWYLAAVENERTRIELARLLKHPEDELRRATADALGRQQRSDLLQALLRALRDEAKPVTRTWMVVGLGNMGDARAGPALTKRLRDEPDPTTRGKIAAALGQLRSAEAVPNLIHATKARDVIVQKSTAWALGEIADPRGVEALIALLKSPDTDVRSIALLSLRSTCADAPADVADHAAWRKWWRKNRQRYR